ncbi:BTAD domain-containing putative transcriptional regulator [Microbaculum marinum]|uniref:BTAD domain-containing putative transcriptional regulator n=1 Tax=Microbaculum marinum TaxID=1764581 RepID=A0AAW9S5G5_9HYPH
MILEPGRSLTLRLLGGLDVRVADAPVRVPTRKVLLLAAAIATAPEMRIGRDRLRTLLWSDRGEEQGRGSLRHALAALRKALPDPSMLSASAEVVALDPDRVFCDATAFAAAPVDGPDRAAEAASLYGGPFLAGIEAPDPSFEGWMLAERRSLHAMALALVDRFDPSAATTAGRESVARLAQRLLAEDPACEEAYRALIRGDLAAGRRNAALRHLEDCRAAVREILGTEPEEMTLRLVDEPAMKRSGPAQSSPSTSGSQAFGPAKAGPVATGPVTTGPVAPEPQRPSIVVLPFKTLSSDPEQGFFADGVVEEITSMLSRVRDFFVIARQTAETLRDSPLDTREIGRALGVRYILEGAVRRAGNRARITVGLIDAEAGTQLWSNRFDGDASDVFDFQDEVASAVAGALHPSLRQAEIDRALRKRPDNLQAYDLILRAYPHFWAHTRDDNAEAAELFGRAIGIEPKNGLATAMLAWCRAQDASYMWDDDMDAARAEAIRLARRAGGLADDDPSTMVAIAAALSITSTDFPMARSLLERSLEIDPNHAWGWMRYGWLQHYERRPREAVEAFDRALKLSPYDPFAFNILVGNGIAHQQLGDYQRAMHLVEAGLRARPTIAWGYRALATTAATAGDIDRARAAIDRLTSAYPNMSIARLRKAVPEALVKGHEIYWEGLRKAGLPEE